MPCPRFAGNECGGQGSCAEGNCTCTNGVCGEACDVVCDATGSLAGCGENGVCSCKDGFFGPSCGKECRREAHCNGNGDCGSDGTCRCADGFGGPDCACSDARSCNNGACTGQGRCVCEAGWAGPDCATRHCASLRDCGSCANSSCAWCERAQACTAPSSGSDSCAGSSVGAQSECATNECDGRGRSECDDHCGCCLVDGVCRKTVDQGNNSAFGACQRYLCFAQPSANSGRRGLCVDGFMLAVAFFLVALF